RLRERNRAMRMGKIDTLERLDNDGSNPEGGDRRGGSSIVLEIDTDSNGAVGVARSGRIKPLTWTPLVYDLKVFERQMRAFGVHQRIDIPSCRFDCSPSLPPWIVEPPRLHYCPENKGPGDPYKPPLAPRFGFDRGSFNGL